MCQNKKTRQEKPLLSRIVENMKSHLEVSWRKSLRFKKQKSRRVKTTINQKEKM